VGTPATSSHCSLVSAHPLFVSDVGGNNVGDDLEPYLTTEILGLIRHKARQLAGKYGFRRDEFEDIHQSLVLDFLERSRRFDSRRGSERSFARSVINHGVATLIEAQNAQGRGHRFHHLSLSAPSDDANPNSPAVVEMISDPAQVSAGTLQRRVDVVKAIKALPARLRQVCLLLMVVDRIAQVATIVGISRATLQRRIQLIRKAFTEARLSDYKGNPQ
jgi:DNA-directed RNA polymerase specialized sigma24 family protein